MRKVFFIAAALIIGGSPVAAQYSSGGGLTDDVAQMETRFFEHTYPTQTMADRLDRIEKMVFGEARPGSDQDRVTALLLALPAAQPGTSTASTAGSPAQSPVAQTASAGGTTTDNQSDSGDADDTTVDATSYPHVTALETEILGHSYETLPVTKRLDQLESKVFGKSTGNPDLSARVDQLERYAETHLHQKPFGQHPHYAMAPPDDSDDGGPAQTAYGTASRPAAPHLNPLGPAPHDGPMLDKVSWMERRLYGQAYKQDHLLDRLKRIDQRLFPNEPPPPAFKLMDQVDMLLAAAEHTPAAPQREVADDTEIASAGGSDDDGQPAPAPSHHPIMRDVAKVLGTVGNMAIGGGGSGPYMNPMMNPMMGGSGVWF